MSSGGLTLFHSPPLNSGATAECCYVKAVTAAGKPHTGRKDGLVWNTPGFRAVHHFEANLTQAGEGNVGGAEVVHLQLWECQAGDSLCSLVSCPVLMAPKVWWRVCLDGVSCCDSWAMWAGAGALGKAGGDLGSGSCLCLLGL